MKLFHPSTSPAADSTASSPNPLRARKRAVVGERPREATIRSARAASGSSPSSACSTKWGATPYCSRSKRIAASPRQRPASASARLRAKRMSSTRPSALQGRKSADAIGSGDAAALEPRVEGVGREVARAQEAAGGRERLRAPPLPRDLAQPRPVELGSRRQPRPHDHVRGQDSPVVAVDLDEDAAAAAARAMP